MDNEQRCGTCKWWEKDAGQEGMTQFIVGDCMYPLPISLSKDYRISPYASAGKDCPTWHAK